MHYITDFYFVARRFCQVLYFCAMKNRISFFVVALSLTALFAFDKMVFQSPEQLGERLFFDPILSLDSTISCSSCHIPQFAFSDTAFFSRGVGGRTGSEGQPDAADSRDAGPILPSATTR